MVVHDLQGFGGEHFRAHRLAVDRHDVIDAGLAHVHALVQGAAQVTIGEDAGEPAVRFQYRGHAQALAGHFQQRLAQWRAAGDEGQAVTAVHDVFHLEQQAPAEGAARMGEGEVFGGEAAGFQQRDGQGVAQHQGRGGGGGRGEVQRAGLLGDAGVQVGGCGLGQGGVRIAGEADQGEAQALDQWQQGDDFGGRARVGQGQDHILAGDHAHVAMAGFRRVNEEGGGAGAGQGGCDLLADMP
ncbi:hypothetical protein FQZ97_890880 [compost metagenome]